MRRKLDRLLDHHPLRLVHPVADRRWIVKVDEAGHERSRRRSPKRGIPADVCRELVAFPSLLSHPNFSLEIVLIDEEQVRRPDRRAWRGRGYALAERRLLRVIDSVHLREPCDLLSLIPARLPDPFTTADLATALGRSRPLATKVAYCLRLAEVIEVVGRRRHGIEYRVS